MLRTVPALPEAVTPKWVSIWTGAAFLHTQTRWSWSRVPKLGAKAALSERNGLIGVVMLKVQLIVKGSGLDRRSADDAGVGALALLASLLVLGVLAVIVTTSLQGGWAEHRDDDQHGEHHATNCGLGQTDLSGRRRHPRRGDRGLPRPITKLSRAAESYYQAQNGSPPKTLASRRVVAPRPHILAVTSTSRSHPTIRASLMMGTRGHPLSAGELNCVRMR